RGEHRRASGRAHPTGYLTPSAPLAEPRASLVTPRAYRTATPPRLGGVAAAGQALRARTTSTSPAPSSTSTAATPSMPSSSAPVVASSSSGTTSTSASSSTTCSSLSSQRTSATLTTGPGP